MRELKAAGGFHALKYTLDVANRVGWLKLWRAMRSKNACKTCALGMGGQKGGMVNELGHFPEVCKKSLQAMAADMQGALPARFHDELTLDQWKALSPRELETAGRLVRPLLAEAGARRFRAISWDDALSRIAARIKATPPDESFFYFSGRSSNEAGFALQLFARIYGSNHVSNCSYYCHQASGVGLGESVGVGTATVQATDLEKADLVFLIGGNPASNHPRLMTHLMHLRRRGGQVIVVNPVRETGLVRFRIPSDPWSLVFGTKIATDYVQLHIGGDIAYLMGVAKGVLALGAQDDSYLATWTEGFADVKAQLDGATWESLEIASGVTRAEMERDAATYAKSERVIFAWTMGITHHVHGSDNVRWIANLALLRGMVGKDGAGLLPIRGHSNVQGLGTIGVAPSLKPALQDRFRAAGIALPTMRGFDTMEALAAAHAGKMRFGIALGGNLFGATPDAVYARDAIGRLDMMVYLSTALNTGHAHGLAKETLILPVLARDEEPYATTQESMFSYVRMSDGGAPRHEGPMGEVPLIADLAARVVPTGGPVDFAKLDAEALRGWMARLVPGMEGAGSIAETKQEFTIPGRMLRDGFPTPSGKAQMAATALPERRLKSGELMLMTVRSEGQFNTVVYEDTDVYRTQERRDVILMHENDLARLGFEDGDRVDVKGPAGTFTGALARAFAIREGNALMYYPEANVLVPFVADPRSRTPPYKAVPVTLTASKHGEAVPSPGRVKRKLKTRDALKSC